MKVTTKSAPIMHAHTHTHPMHLRRADKPIRASKPTPQTLMMPRGYPIRKKQTRKNSAQPSQEEKRRCYPDQNNHCSQRSSQPPHVLCDHECTDFSLYTAQ